MHRFVLWVGARAAEEQRRTEQIRGAYVHCAYPICYLGNNLLNSEGPPLARVGCGMHSSALARVGCTIGCNIHSSALHRHYCIFLM
jgi:hypothetical protein